MSRKLLQGNARLFALITLFTAFQLLSKDVQAQSRLIHYWNFNTFTSVIHLPATASLAADYTAISSPLARLAYTPVPSGVSGAYLGYSDFGASATADYDTVNSQFGTVGGNYFRARNPSDSMQLLLYIPSTNYQNITIRYGTESSSLTSGDSAQIYAYSLDSGVTWNTAGLSVPSLNLNSSPFLAFAPGSVTINDPLANNNPKLVFRITTKGRNTGTSGNNRFDNITVKGDTIMPGGTCIYLWDFNTFAGTYANPNFPYLAPDYFIHDSSKAKVHMGLFPGTSLANPTFFDVVTTATSDYDTVWSNWTSIGLGIVPGGNGIRPRNPLDSAWLYYYMPTVNYKNIVLTWAAETSSFTSGDSCEVFSYSVDSGATWRISGLSKLTDSALLTFKKIQVTFTDPAVNNCSKLVFRIAFKGRNHGTSGNNRFDNISVQGDSIITPAPTLTTTPAAYGPFCNSTTSTVSVPFTMSVPISGSYAVQLSNVNGVFPTDFTSNIIGTGTGSPITATIPSGTLPGIVYRIRVVTAYPGIFGTDNGSDITISGVAAPISGPATVCAGGGTSTLIETGGGTWSSTNPALATIGSGTGIVTGVAPGVDTIMFSVGSGCFSIMSITVNPTAAVITGASNVCVSGTTTLADASGTGTWTSGTTSVAAIGSSSGIVSGLSVGSSAITYTLPGGCFQTWPVTVNPLPAAITGTTVLCQGTTTTLADAGGGTWTSGTTSVATVGSTGVVSGLAGGTSVITYALPTGCFTTAPVTVNPTPSAITGSATGCVGTTTPLSDLTGFGAWSSTTPGVATIGSSTGLVTGVSVGTTVISYTVSTGCYTTKTMTINSLPSSITGTFVFCAGATSSLANSTPGGYWSSSNTALATVGSTGIVTGIAAGSPTITYTLPSGCLATQVITVNPLPAAIGGTTSVYCIGSTANLTDATSGGTWTSGNPAVATAGSSSGIVTGVTAGTAIITYALPTGCIATLTENITSSPATITGPSNQCVGTSTNLSDVTAFGAWTSSNTGIATVGSGTGIVTGVAVGTATITYSLSSFCQTTKTVTVNPPPAANTGTASVCAASTTILSNTGSGVWSSSVPALGSIDAGTGVVAGIAAGNPVITFTAASGCIATTVLTVNPLPAPIGGTTSVYCIGSTAALADFIPGGTWTSNNLPVATVGSSSGIVTGITAGTAIITYMLPTGCYTTLTENITSTPAPITGTPNACISNTTSFSDVTAFGAWSSSNTAVATIGSGTGILTGVSAGTALITYGLSPFCLITKPVTVNPNPLPAGGIPQVCIGSTTTLTEAGGGTWISSIPALATVGSSSGIVTGIVAGNVNITYTLPTGCFNTTPVTINPLPSITGPSTICLGLPATLAGTIGGGTWVSSNTAVATIGSGTGIILGSTLGTTNIIYTLPTGCTASMTVTVNPPPSPISGTMQVCAGFTTTLTDAGGGGWYSSNTSVATIGFGTGIVTAVSAGNTTITYTTGTSCISTALLTVNPLPAAILGITTVCPGVTSTLTDVLTGGSWVSATTSVASIGSSSGVVTGVTGGTSAITYTLPTGCLTTTVVTVNPVVPVTGTMQVCVGSTTTLSDVLTGGTWTSSNTALATVGSGSGIVTGVASGTPSITYTLPTGCITTVVVTVNPVPSPITGTTNVCQGSTTPLADASTGGTWGSDDISTATIGSTGVVYGVSNGTCNISYTLTTGCMATTSFTVNYLPAAITGTTQACVALSDTLADVTTGGTWTSGSTSIATITSGAGVVTSIMAGTSSITYTLPTGCMTTATFTVYPLPFADTITGGGTFCAGGAGVHILLSGSDTGINYQLYNGGSTIGSAVHGSGTSLDFGLHNITGTYHVVATNTATGCMDNMYGSSVITANPLPFINTITGGGHYCVGSPGVHVGLGGSDTGINYQLFRNGSTIVGSPLAGIGLPLDYGIQTIPGNYTVVATNPVTTCSSSMVGTAVVVVDTLYSPVVSISAHPAGAFKYGDFDTLKATAANAGPGAAYQWVVNLTYIAGATSATYVSNAFNQNDSVTCLVTSHGPCGSVTSFKSVTINILNVGVQPLVFDGADIRLIPNPNKGTFTIKGSLGTTVDKDVTLIITDMLGKTVYRNEVLIKDGIINELVLLNSSLANGMYLLNVRSGTENKVFHFVVEQ